MRMVVRWIGGPLAALLGAIGLLQLLPSPASEEGLREAEARVLSIVRKPLRHQMVQAGPHRLHTVIVGDGIKPPLVMLHGHGGGVGVFAQNFDALAEHYTVYAIDLLGWGRSDRPRFGGRTAEEARAWWVDSLEAWRQTMGLEQMTLLGHSMGGFVAASYALEHPQAVTRLILADAAGMRRPVHPVTGAYFNLTPQRLVRLAGPFGPALVANRRQEDNLRSPYDNNALLDYYYQLSAQPASGEAAFTRILRLRQWKLPLLERLAGLQMPVTLIWGEEDEVVSPQNGLLANERIPNSQLILIPGSGHSPYLDAPDRFNEAVIGIEETR
ncbi:MAG: alpha/beta fold hydrolase [Anaerolineae bacterium]